MVGGLGDGKKNEQEEKMEDRKVISGQVVLMPDGVLPINPFQPSLLL